MAREWKVYPGHFGFGGQSAQVLLYDLLKLYVEQGCRGSQVQFGTLRHLFQRRGERNPSKRDYERLRRDLDILRGYDFPWSSGSPSTCPRSFCGRSCTAASSMTSRRHCPSRRPRSGTPARSSSARPRACSRRTAHPSELRLRAFPRRPVARRLSPRRDPAPDLPAAFRGGRGAGARAGVAGRAHHRGDRQRRRPAVVDAVREASGPRPRGPGAPPQSSTAARQRDKPGGLLTEILKDIAGEAGISLQ